MNVDMNARTKSILIIIATLLIGIAIGALGTGTILNQRVETLQALREDDGFMFFIERVVEPVDETQQQKIRAVLKEAAQKRRQIRRSVVEEHRTLFTEIRSELDQILTDEQKAKLKAWVENEMRKGGPYERKPPPFMRGRPDGFGPDSARIPRRFKQRRQARPDSAVVD